MGKRMFICVALALAALPASPQSSEPSSEREQGRSGGVLVVVAAAPSDERVMLPEAPGISTGWMIGIGAAAALALASITVVQSCDDSAGGDCGPAVPTATTGTR